MNAELPRKRIIGYSDKLSVAPGETIAFKVSCEDVASYDASIIRLISADLHPKGRGWITEPVESAIEGSYPGREQAIPAGSWGLVPSKPCLCAESFALNAWVWPTTPLKGEQVIMARMTPDGARGWSLGLDLEGALAMTVVTGKGSVTFSSGVPLLKKSWCFVGASVDGEAGTVTVWQRPQKVWPGYDSTADQASAFQGYVDCGGLPLSFGARYDRREGRQTFGQGRQTFGQGHYNGKIDAPRLYRRAMGAAEALACHAEPWHETSLIAAWDFSLAMTSDRIVDVSASHADGCLFNVPTRAMKGHNWTGDVLDWKAVPEQYGAIHFHDDDIHDCGWETDFALIVPDSLKSGIYAAKMQSGGDVDFIPFVVLPPRGEATAEVLFVMPSASYMAYGNEHSASHGGGFMQSFSNSLSGLSAQDLLLNERPDLGYSLYDVHSDGSGVAYSSRLRPILNFRPGVTNAWVGPAGTFPWQFNADLPLIDFLTHNNIAFDVATDEDLDREGLGLLSRYQVVLTGSHPEYYSKNMLEGLDGFVQRGGRLMYLGGNGFYWRVAYNPDLPGILELRRAEDGIRDWVAEGGEYYHSFDGSYGGMWERMGHPIHALAGVGMAGQGFDACGFYRRTQASHDPRAAFVFEGIEDEIIGDFGTVGGGAAGIEVDRCDFSKGSPPNTMILASSEGLPDTYYPGPEEIDNASPLIDGSQNPNLRADMTFMETNGGGAVFSTGSIAWIGSLTWNGFDNNVAQVTENVLRRFLEVEPF
ncbi:MAG: N,N-dimethylformamidase [Alphaproteobacteria bacterium]|jgi:N,N-dimethylformamidase|nr:N,N-dimethylformamidase [Rhodospirillaceae bacterium]MDG2479404.1 N,N-dimethylformamidase [Alphaproteobacteria bacterium]